jgi:hypothetical protein
MFFVQLITFVIVVIVVIGSCDLDFGLVFDFGLVLALGLNPSLGLDVEPELEVEVEQLLEINRKFFEPFFVRSVISLLFCD